MTILGVDYSSRPPDPKRLAELGYRFAARYLSPPPNPKNLTAPEAKALLAAGVDIVTVWETVTGATLGGAVVGETHGARAKMLADSLGAPAGAAIYYTVDFDAQPGQFPSIAAYQRTFAAVVHPHPVGVYGSFTVVEAMVRAGAIFGWQTAAWSHGRRSTQADIFQRVQQVIVGGIICDVDEANGSYGGWLTPTPLHPVPLPLPPPLTGPEEDTVLIPVQLPPVPSGSGWWDCDGNPGVVGDPANPPRPLIRWADFRGLVVNGNDGTPDPSDDGKVRANEHGLPDGTHVVRIGWRGFQAGAAPLVWVQTSAG